MYPLYGKWSLRRRICSVAWTTGWLANTGARYGSLAPSYGGLHSNLRSQKNYVACESEVAPSLVFVESCTHEAGIRRPPAPKWAAHGHAGLTGRLLNNCCAHDIPIIATTKKFKTILDGFRQVAAAWLVLDTWKTAMLTTETRTHFFLVRCVADSDMFHRVTDTHTHRLTAQMVQLMLSCAVAVVTLPTWITSSSSSSSSKQPSFSTSSGSEFSPRWFLHGIHLISRSWRIRM